MRNSKWFAAFLWIGLTCAPAFGADYGKLRYFWTDACTAFPDGTLERPTLWQQCCVEHDFKYWAGGTAGEKLKADEALFDCVKDLGEPEIAVLLFAGVTVGGSPFIPDSFRWGYGWPKLRGFSALTADEEAQVKALTPSELSLVPITKTPRY
jgi:hypothetical protein